MRRWRRLSLDSFLQTAGFFLLVGVFWYLCYRVVARLYGNIYDIAVIGPLILKRILSIGFFAAFLILTGGHVLTAYSSLFRGHELPKLFVSPYPMPRLYRIQCLETLILGGWVLGLFCVPFIFAYGWVLRAGVWYYPTILLGLAGFLAIAGVLGILIMLFLARWIIGRPVRTLIAIVVFLGAFLGSFLLFAVFNRDWLGKVDAGKLSEILANLQISSIPYLPSQWMAELMTASRTGDVGGVLLYLLMLWSTALFFWHLILELGHRWYADAWLWTQDRVGLFARPRERHRFRCKRLWLMKLFPRSVGSILYKEYHVFARDFSQWGQLVLILALVLFYVAHTKNIIFDSPDSRVRGHLAFFNVILLGFIQATLSLRYTFPSISLEGRAFWVVAGSKMGLTRVYFTKYYLHALALLVLGEGMGWILNRILDVDPILNGVSAFILFLFAFGFTSWTLGLGAVFRKFEATSAADVTSDTGALVTMIFTLLYFGVSVAFLARFALDHTPGIGIISEMALQPDMILYSTFFLLLQSCAILLPLAFGLKKLQAAEF